MTTIGGLPASPPNSPHAGVRDRSNQNDAFASSHSITYSLTIPEPPHHRPAPPESGRKTYCVTRMGSLFSAISIGRSSRSR